jgi:hypothetical protein
MSAQFQARAVHTIPNRFSSQDAAPPLNYPRWLRIAFGICIVIAVAAVILRAAALLSPRTTGPAPVAELDAYFASRAGLTFTHILSALVFVLLLPFLFWRRTRDSRPVRSAFFVLGYLVGITAYAMSTHAIGGWLERGAVLLFNTLFLACLTGALVSSSGGNTRRAESRRWMLRAVAILLGIATTRPVIGVFFATSRITHLSPRQFFGVAFWIGFSVNALVMELWIRKQQRIAERTPR